MPKEYCSAGGLETPDRGRLRNPFWKNCRRHVIAASGNELVRMRVWGGGETRRLQASADEPSARQVELIGLITSIARIPFSNRK